MQGIGWALNEEYIYGADGKLQNAGFLDYRMPVASDVPMIDAILVEVANPKHPYGVRGVGETPIVPPLGAIANAMEQATGIRFTELPMSPPKVLKALKEREAAARSEQVTRDRGAPRVPRGAPNAGGVGAISGPPRKMARVVLIGNLAQLTGGVAEFQLSATSVKQLFQQLTELHPAIEPHLRRGHRRRHRRPDLPGRAVRADRSRQRGVPPPADRRRRWRPGVVGSVPDRPDGRREPLPNRIGYLPPSAAWSGACSSRWQQSEHSPGGK